MKPFMNWRAWDIASGFPSLHHWMCLILINFSLNGYIKQMENFMSEICTLLF